MTELKLCTEISYWKVSEEIGFRECPGSPSVNDGREFQSEVQSSFLFFPRTVKLSTDELLDGVEVPGSPSACAV